MLDPNPNPYLDPYPNVRPHVLHSEVARGATTLTRVAALSCTWWAAGAGVRVRIPSYFLTPTPTQPLALARSLSLTPTPTRWAAGAGVLTFYGPFKATSNGCFASPATTAP